MQAAQDITIGARLSQTQYQYTLMRRRRQRTRSHGRRSSSIKLKTLPQMTDVASDQEQCRAAARHHDQSRRGIELSRNTSSSTIDNTLDDAFGQRIVSTIYTSLNQYHVVLEVGIQYEYVPHALCPNSGPHQFARLASRSPFVHADHQHDQAAAPIVINHS